MMNKNMPIIPPVSNEYLKVMNKNMAKLFEKVNNELLRKTFKSDIKETFLIKILGIIKNQHPDILNFYVDQFNINILNFLKGIDIEFDYDICCHIVGIHKSNTLFLSNEEKGKLQKSIEYQKKLCEQVYEHIQLRKYGSAFFRNKPLINGDRFLYFTMGYDMFVISMYISDLIRDKSFRENELFVFYVSMIEQVISILTLVENGLLRESFPQCRNLIELYFKYRIILKHPDAFSEYDDFCKYEINYATYGKFDEDFNDKYNSICKNKNVDKIDYLHFGWIDEIFDIDYLGKDKQYSITGLYNYLSWLNKNDNNLIVLRDTHKMCHMFSHGSTIRQVDPIKSYFSLIQVLYIILKFIFIEICDYSKKEAIFNGINIKLKIENDYKDFMEKMRLLITESVNK